MKKWLLRIGLGFFGFLALLYAFVFLRSIMPATVMDKDLQLQRASLPAGSNAFDTLEGARRHLSWPDNQNGRLSELARNTNWDDSLANTVLANNREALAGWDAAAKMPDLQVPEISNANDLLPYLADCKKLLQLAEVQENVLLRAGKDQEGFNQIVNHIQIGRKMQNSGGSLITYLVGTAVNNIGLMQMRNWTGKTHFTPPELKSYIRQLELDPADEGAAFANSMRAEYQSSIGTMEALRSGNLMDPDTGNKYPFPKTRLLPVFNFNQTKALFARGFLPLVKAAPHHFNEARLPDMNTRPGPVSLILSGNLTGQILYNMLMPALTPALAKKSQSDAELQATRTILALRAYQLTHGKLPADLNALVPEFLDSVPVDDFDGQPLRYLPEQKTVYSVGENLKDDGGDDSRNGRSNRQLDLVYKFDF